MASPRGGFIVRSSALGRGLAALTVAALLVGCGSLGGPHLAPSPRATIEFDNQSTEPVRVYLVIPDAGEYLLGRVYPMQTSSLMLPRHLPITDSRRASLVVVPLAGSSFAHRLRSGPHTREFVASFADLVTQRYLITPLALHGSTSPSLLR